MTSPTLTPNTTSSTSLDPLHPLDQGGDRLAQIAALLTPCTPPEPGHGYDLCAHAVPWPCPTTRAAWLARGVDDGQAVWAALPPGDPADPDDDTADQAEGTDPGEYWCESCRRMAATTIWTHRGMAFALCQTCTTDARTAATHRIHRGGGEPR